MQTDTITLEVQRIDGTPASIMEAINLILSRFSDNPEFKLPKSAEEGFFREAHKTILNWIAEKGGSEKMKELLTSLNVAMMSDKILLSPFSGVGYKYRFAAKLSCIYNLLETYLESSLYIKTYFSMTCPERAQCKDLLAKMWKLDRAASKQEISVIFTEVGASADDLQYLIEECLVKEQDFEGEMSFELTPGAFGLLDALKLK